MPRIVVFTSKTGRGHVSLAEALCEALACDSAFQIIDPQHGIIHWHYRMVSRHALWLWAAEFKFADTPTRALAVHKIFSASVARRLDAVLASMRPDLVLTTYAFMTYEVMRAIERTHRQIPFLMHLSDPNSVHSVWLTEQKATAVLAPTHETYMRALAAGFALDRIHITGWPVRSPFYRTHNSIRSEMLARLNLNPSRFTVFLQGGGEGAAKFERAVENILAIGQSSAGPSIQLILSVGTNRTLLEHFGGVHSLRVVPFTSEIAPFMAAADVVMGKAGPNTLFEAMVLGKPFIATVYIPGQEEPNLEFIQRHQLGWVALDARSQRELITTLATEPAQLMATIEKVKAYRQWNMEANKALVPVTQKYINKL